MHWKTPHPLQSLLQTAQPESGELTLSVCLWQSYGQWLMGIGRGFPLPPFTFHTLSPYSLSVFLLLLLLLLLFPHYRMVHWLLTKGLNKLWTGCLCQGPHSHDSLFKLPFLWVRKPLGSLTQCRTAHALPIPPWPSYIMTPSKKRGQNSC